MRKLVSAAGQPDTRTREVEPDKSPDNYQIRWVVLTFVGLSAGVVTPVPWQSWAAEIPAGPFVQMLARVYEPPFLLVFLGILGIYLIRSRFRGIAGAALAFMIGTILAHLRLLGW